MRWLSSMRLTGKKQPYTTVMLDSLISKPHRQQFIQTVKADPLMSNIKVVLLLPFGPGVNEQKWRQCGVDEVLSKPIHRTQLFRCLESKPNDSQKYPLIPEQAHLSTGTPSLNPSASQVEGLPSTQGPCILVAEDNLVNQKVVSWALGKLGCQVTLVGTGVEAVEASASGGYDVIFMDWQMPEMDGLEATRAIRRREAFHEIQNTNDEIRDTSHVPIIGMTANAMKGDRDECLEAGMDDYMAKPHSSASASQDAEKVGADVLPIRNGAL